MRLMLALALCLPVPAEACRLALLLAVDVSRSVDAQDYAIQREGIVAALGAPEVRAAFLSGDPVALAVYEWSGRGFQEMVADWRLIEGPGDLDAVAAVVGARVQPARSLPTALGRALEFGLRAMGGAPTCSERVLDVSGDGRNNEGYSPADIYARRDFGDLVVNGLAIGEHEADVAEYYRREVIRGAGAFVEVAETQADFPAAIRRKLVREATPRVIGAAGAGPSGG